MYVYVSVYMYMYMYNTCHEKWWGRDNPGALDPHTISVFSCWIFLWEKAQAHRISSQKGRESREFLGNFSQRSRLITLFSRHFWMNYVVSFFSPMNHYHEPFLTTILQLFFDLPS